MISTIFALTVAIASAVPLAVGIIADMLPGNR
jgi:hypothetical protein